MAKPIKQRRPGGGRKPLAPGVAKSAMLTLRLRPVTLRVLAKRAQVTGQSVNALVADLIDRELGLSETKEGNKNE